MKKKIFLTIVLVSLVFTFTAKAQTSCKVLLPAIAGNYAGECKNGIAEGSGQATGEDFYRGDFKNGLPEGKGVYTWKNGATYEGDWKLGLRHGRGIYSYKTHNIDSVLNGVWKNDKFLGEKAPEPYVIEYRNGVGRVTCMRIGDRPYVKYIFSRNGGESNNISGLMMQGSSGNESQTPAFTGYDYVKFPFHGNLKFFAPNNFYSATITCELRLTVNKPGGWLVTIFY
jgi:hypothetical protein